MGQADVLEVLESYRKPMSRSDIAKVMQVNEIVVSHAITRLVKSKDIKIIEINRDQAMKLYRCKRRMRLYYV